MSWCLDVRCPIRSSGGKFRRNLGRANVNHPVEQTLELEGGIKLFSPLVGQLATSVELPSPERRLRSEGTSCFICHLGEELTLVSQGLKE
jgi:hypothetical protein